MNNEERCFKIVSEAIKEIGKEETLVIEEETSGIDDRYENYFMVHVVNKDETIDKDELVKEIVILDEKIGEMGTKGFFSIVKSNINAYIGIPDEKDKELPDAEIPNEASVKED